MDKFVYKKGKKMSPYCDIKKNAIHYLFKMAPKMSTVYIKYGDHDLDTATVINKKNRSIKNISSAINPNILTEVLKIVQKNK